MAERQVVLVTGVSDYWGQRVARRLLAESDLHVIGIDVAAPEDMPEGLDFVEADVRSPLLPELLEVARVDTVCHMAFNETIGLSEAAFDQNVMGTIKLVGACAESGVRRIVLKSSTMVYGANADNDAFLTEESDLRGGRRYGYNRYQLEIESFLNGFRRQAPQLGMTVLRFANIVGPTADTPLTRYLEHRVTPVLFGFDPMMQVIHENDAIEAIAQSIQTEVEGIFNVAADPPLPLLRILAIAGRVPCPVIHPFAYRGRTWFGSRRLRLRAAFEPDYLRFRWVADTEKMKDELGLWPVHTADEAVASLSAKMRTSQYGRSVDSAYDEAKLEQEIEQRRRHAFASAESGPEAGAFNED